MVLFETSASLIPVNPFPTLSKRIQLQLYLRSLIRSHSNTWKDTNGTSTLPSVLNYLIHIQHITNTLLTNRRNSAIIVIDIHYAIYIINYWKNGRMTNMAPKNKFTREEMVAAAVRVVQKMGAAALTAKSLAEELGTSTQPVFTCFGTMDAAKSAVYAAAERMFDEYLTVGLKEKIPFFGFGTQYIRFARKEPELYRLLFLMRPDDRGSDAFAAMRHMQELVRPSLIDIYYIGEQEADRYFRDLWLVVHSLATLIVTGDCPYSDREIGQILTGFSVSIFKAIKEIPGFTEGTFDRDATFRSLIQGK